MQIKDHFLSKERFNLEEDAIVKGYLRTQPIPSDLDFYYESEEYFSHGTSEKTLFSVLYSISKKINAALKYQSIKPYLIKEESILDYGCGIGDFSVYLSKKGYSIKASEPNQKAAEKASKSLGSNVLNPDEIEDKIGNDSLGAVMLWHVLEHVQAPKTLISLLRKKMKSKGSLIIALPNHSSYDAKYYKDFWAAWDVPRHLHHWNREAIKEWGESCGLKLITSKPLWLDAFYVALLSEKYKGTGIEGKLRGVCKGLTSNIVACNTNEFSSQIHVFRKI